MNPDSIPRGGELQDEPGASRAGVQNGTPSPDGPSTPSAHAAGSSANSVRVPPRMLRLAWEAAGVASWVLDLRTGAFRWISGDPSLVGSSSEPSNLEAQLAAVHSDDRDRVLATYRAAFGGAPLDREFRVLSRGSVRWLRVRAELECDADAVP